MQPARAVTSIRDLTTFITIIFASLLLCLLSAQTHSSPATMIGTVVYSKGEVSVTRDGTTLPIQRRDTVSINDTVRTGANGKFSAKLVDGSVITLGNQSDFHFKQFKFHPLSQEGKAVFKITKGAFRAVTGSIKQTTPGDYRVETPLATIGIRGTDFWGGFIFGNQLDVTVLTGKGVYVENAAGKVMLDTAEGTTVAPNAKPTPAKLWPDEKLQKALESVELDD